MLEDCWACWWTLFLLPRLHVACVVPTRALSSCCTAALQHAPPTGLNLGAINVDTDRRGFVPVNEKMEVLDKAGKVVPNVYCIGDANGKYMLAHAASAQVRDGAAE